MKKGFKPGRRVIAGFVVITFSCLQLSWAQGPIALETPIPEQHSETKIPEDQPPPFPSSIFEPPSPISDSTEFLQNESALSAVHEENETHPYSLGKAFDLLRPEFASAVILDEPLSTEGMQSLFNHSVKEGIEIAVLILHGETVLISSGNEDEITASPAAREILRKTSFSFHAHPDEHLTEGPSAADLEAAGPTTHYVLTTKQAHAYNENGVMETGEIDWLAGKYLEAFERSQKTKDEIKARGELNQLIVEQDRLNRVEEEEKETWVAGSTGLSYTSSLTASNVTMLPGSPSPYILTGSSAPTAVSYNSSTDQFSLAYNVQASGSHSTLLISFDDYSTSTIETRDLSGLSYLIFGVKGPSGKVHVDFVDLNGNSDRFTLKSISSSTERFWKLALSTIPSGVNKTKIKEIRIRVDQGTTSSSTRTGAEVIRIKGLNVNAPTEPILTSSIPDAVNGSTFTLTGTKEAHTSILINGTEVISRNADTTWSYTVNLNTEGNNTFDIQAKNTIGKLSAKKSVTIVKDTASPTGLVNINSGTLYTTSEDVTLNLSGDDGTGSGIDKMSFSTDNVTWTNPEAFAQSKTFTFSAPDGEKMVYVKFFDKAGNTASFLDSIILDATAPTGSIVINEGAQKTRSREVTITIDATDATSRVLDISYSPDGNTDTWEAWEPFTPGMTITKMLSEGDGLKRPHVRVRDQAGNITHPYADITLDTAPAIYYVSKTSSDAQEGSEQNPWQSLQYGVSQLLPGDTLYIQEGVYEESVSFLTSGRADAPITIQGIGNVVLDGRNLADNLDGFDTQGHDWLIFKNLTLNNLNAGIDVKAGSQFIEIDGIRADGNHAAVRIQDSSHVSVKNVYANQNKNAFRIDGTSEDILLEKVEAYNSLDIFPGSNPDYLNGDGVTSEAQVNRLTIRNSIFGNNADAGIDFKGTNGLFENIEVYGNKNNFKMWGTATIQSSLSHHAKRQTRLDGSTVEGNGITVEAGSTRMVNVTLVDNEDHDIQVYAGGNLSVENSIVARRILDPTAMLLESAGTFTSNHVLWFARGQDPNNLTRSSTDLWDDPQFLDWRTGDYRLGFASPALDAGDGASERSTSDLDSKGRVVGNGIDLGAYENQNIALKPLPFQEAGGTLVIEAEHPYAKLAGIAQDWILERNIAGYSGDGYFFADPDTNATYNNPSQYLAKSPELRYEIQIQNPGTYYVWVRGYAAEGKSDSIHVGLDGVAIDTSDRMYFKEKGNFSWSNKTMDLDPEGRTLLSTIDIATAGTHLLNVWMREDGLRFDKILLTQDPDFRPVDFGPEESWRVDTIPPRGKLEIPTGNNFVSSRDVAILLHEIDESSGVGAVRFSEDGLVWRDWETYRGGPKTVTLTGPNGIRKLFAQLRDRAGNVGEVLEEEFILYAPPTDGSLVSLNTQEGFILNYLANELFSVERPGEYTLIAPELDSNQNLTGGVILFEKGGAAFYQNGRLVWHETPQADRYSYNTDGRVTEIRDRNKKRITFSYTVDADNQVQSIQTEAEGFTSTYSSQGRLQEVRKQNGDRLVYENGLLNSITLATGTVISYTTSVLANGTRAELATSAPANYPQSIDYDLEGEVTRVIKQTNEQILFENGIPVRFIDEEGNESTYSYEVNSGGDLAGLTLNKLDYVQHFDTQGNLFAIDLPTTDGVILEAGDPTQVKRFEAQDGKITKIILTDGTAVELGEGGYEENSSQIKNGTIHFSDGSKAKYQDSKLVEIVTQEGISYAVTLQGENYLATQQEGSSSGAATQFILDQNFNAVELTQPKNIVKLRDNKTHEILPNCNPATDTDCEEARFFYYLPDKTVVVQGNFQARPELDLDPGSFGLRPQDDGHYSYSISTFDLQGQPIDMKTYDEGKLTRVDFAYGKIRHVFNCNLDETDCTETLRYTYEFSATNHDGSATPFGGDSFGNETTVVTELATGIVRRYRDNLLKEAVTKDNVITTYTHDSQKRVLTSRMTWQGRTLESYRYEYSEAVAEGGSEAVPAGGDSLQRTRITDTKDVTRIYDTQEKLVGIIQGNREFSILHFTQDGEERTAQELIRETSDSGMIFHYQMGKLTKIEYPDGRILEEIVEDEKEGKIFSAKLTYPDRTSERIVSGARVEIRRPDGSVWEYEYGRLQRRVDQTGRTFIYWYDWNSVRLYEESVNSTYRYNLQGQYLQTDSGLGTPPASLDPLTLSLATISYNDLATNLTKTKTDENSDLFKAKIISSQNGLITLETVYGDQLIYQGGKLVKEIEAGTGHTEEYSYEGDDTILRESGSIQSFNAQRKLFRFVDFKGNAYDVTPVLSGAEITGYDLVSGSVTARLDTKGMIQYVTGGTVSQTQFLDIHFDLIGVPLNLSEVKIQGSASIIKEGNFSLRLKQGTNSQDQAPPQIHVSSPRIIDSSNYTLVYKVDGVEKSKAVTLAEGKNLLTIEETDASGNKTTIEYEVTYILPIPFSAEGARLPDGQGSASGGEEKDGQVVIEAEHPHASYAKGGHSWEYESSMEGESGEGYFVAGPNVGKTRDTDYLTNSPELQYKVQITNPGTYYVWVRGFGPNGASDSVHVGLDGQAVDTADRINFWPNGQWKWSKNTQDKDAAGNTLRASLEITTAGVHTLNVWMREDGFIFDKILLTTDPNFVPQDLGPNESTRNYTSPSSDPTSTLASLFEDYKKSQMASEEVMYSVFDKDGKLVYTEKVNGTITEYIQGRITSVWDRSGRLLQSYEYGAEENPTKITLHRMREEFPRKIQTAREEVEKQKNEALRGLAGAEANAVQQIQETYGAERAKLEAQRSNLESQRYQTQCQRMACFEQCQTVEVPGVASAIAQVSQALSDLNAQEAQAYANLKTEVSQARNTIDTEVTKAFQTIEGEDKKFKDEIIRQEISPVVFHYYRKILGRDPSEAEYNQWIQETDFNVGLDIAKLKNFLNTTPELGQRQASVSQIKSLVTQFVNDYKGRSKDEKIMIAQTQLGLLPEDLTHFTSEEADKILQWLNSRSLHFGQSAYIALEKMLEQAGLEKVPGSPGEAEVPGTFSREALAKKLILVDILSGIITPFSAEGARLPDGQGSASGGEELLISLFSIKHVAKLYGLNTEGLNTQFEDLASFYKTHAGHRMIAHINGDHYVIVTGIKDGKVTYIDPGAGPEGSEAVAEGGSEAVPGGGAGGGNNQIMEVSMEEFLKVWDGNVLVTETTSQVLIQQHNEDPNLKPNPPPQVLTKPELQKIRGSFFFFLIPFFFHFVFAAIVSVATAVAGVVGAAAAAISAVIGPLLAGVQGAILGIVSGLEALAGAFLGFATTLLQAISFVGHTLVGVIGTIGQFAFGIVSEFVTGFASAALSSTAAKFVVGAATLSFGLGGVEGILTAIGVSPKAAHYIGVGFNIVGAIATGNPILIASTLASTAVTEVGPRIGLSPALTSALSIATSALAGTIAGGAFDPNTTVFQALKNAAPKLIGSFAQTGFIALGDAIGLDPRLTSLIGIGTGAFAKGLTAGLMNANGGGFGSILNSVKNAVLDKGTIGGLISVGAGIGLGEIGAPPIARNFISGFLGQLAAGFVGGSSGGGSPGDIESQGQGILSKIGEGLQKFGWGVTNAVGNIISFGQKVIEGVGNVTVQGFKKAISAFSSIFNRQTQEGIYQDETGLRQATVTTNGDIWTWQNASNRIDYNVQTAEATESFGGGTARITGLSQDESGNYYYEKLTYENVMDGGATLRENYVNGRLSQWGYYYGNNAIIKADALDSRGWQVGDGWMENAHVEIKAPISIEIPDNLDTPVSEVKTLAIPFAFNFTVLGGEIMKASANLIQPEVRATSSPMLPTEQRDLFVLVNGINSKTYSNSPSYLFNLQNDIVKESENRVSFDDIILAPTFFKSIALALIGIGTDFNDIRSVMNLINPANLNPIKGILGTVFGDALGQILNSSKDVLKLVSEAMDPQAQASLASDIRSSLENYFNTHGDNTRARELISVGYSGGFLPLAEVLVNNRYNADTQAGYNAKSLVGLGAVPFQLSESTQAVIDQASFLIEIIGKLKTVTDEIFDAIESGLVRLVDLATQLTLLGAGDELAQTTMDYLKQGSLMGAYDYLFNRVKEMVTRMSLAPAINLTQAEMNVVVNVYGTQDTAHKLGVGAGYRDEIGGYIVGDDFHPLVNIEIVGADHHDYIRGDVSLLSGTIQGIAANLIDYVLTEEDREWNATVSTFVADLILNSNDFQKLEAFLNEQKALGFADKQDDRWIITLPGYQERI